MLRALIFVGLTGLAGCDVGEVPLNGTGLPDGGGSGSNGVGEASFNQMVAPIISAKGCTTGVGCHSLQPPVLTSFANLGPNYKTKPGASNILVTKGSLTAGIHQGIPYLDAAQQAAVAG